MDTLSYTAARQNFAETINQVVRDRTPVIIRKKKDAVVMISLDDYESWAETVYLLRSPENAKRLTSAIEALENPVNGIEKSPEALSNE